MAVEVDWRADVGAFILPPDLVGRGDVARSADADGQRRVSASDRVHDVIVRHDARANVAMNALGIPQGLAVVGAEALDPAFHADNQLGSFLSRDDERSVP